MSLSSIRIATLLLWLVLVISQASSVYAWQLGHVEAGLPDALKLQDVTHTAFSHGSGTTSTRVLSESVRVLAQGDWLNTRRTGFLATQSSDHNHSVLQLWENRGEDEALYHVWSSAPLPIESPAGSHTSATAAQRPFIVSAVGVDTLQRGVLDVVVQTSDGHLYFLDGTLLRLGASGYLPSRGDAVLQPLRVSTKGGVDVSMQDPTAPLLSLAPLRAPCHAPDLVFVNRQAELVVLSSVTDSDEDQTERPSSASHAGCVYETIAAEKATLSASQGSVQPVYVARSLLNGDTTVSWRAEEAAQSTQPQTNVDDTMNNAHRSSAPTTTAAKTAAAVKTVLYGSLPGLVVENPVSLTLQDVNEDCGAELIFTMTGLDADAHEKTQVYLAAYAPTTNAVTVLLALPRFTDDAHGTQSIIYGTPLLTDMNGDGLVDLVVPVRLSVEDEDLAQGGFSRLQVFFNTRGDTTTYLGGHCADASVARSTQTLLGVDSASVRDPVFTAAQSTLYNFTRTNCGVAAGSTATWAANTAPLAFMQLQGDASRAHVPLLLRDGDGNRDHLTDLLIPSNYGPLLLSGMHTGKSHAAAATAAPYRTTASSHGFYCAPIDAASHTAGDESFYVDSTPFFTTLGRTAGQLHVALSLVDPFPPPGTATPAGSLAVSAIARIYKVTNIPLQRYFVQLADITRGALEMTSVAALNTSRVEGRVEAEWRKEMPYGVLQVGAVHRLGWQDTHMSENWAIATQGARTAGLALSLPRPLLGLGSTFSYIHDYTVGCVVSTHASRRSDDSPHTARVEQEVLKKQWPSYLVPNTQLFAVQEPADQPVKWVLKLYLPTSQYRTLLLVTLAVILVVLGIPIACLRWSEIREDYKEWNNRL